MKKNLIVGMLMVLWALVPVVQGFAAEAIPSAPSVTGPTQTSSATITVEDMRKAIRSATKNVANEVTRKNNNILSDNTKVWAESYDHMSNAINENTGVLIELSDGYVKMTNVLKGIPSSVDQSGKKVVRSIDKSLMILGGAILLAIFIVVVHFGRKVKGATEKVNKAVRTALDDIERIDTNVRSALNKIDMTPELTSALTVGTLKELEGPYPLTNVGTAKKSFELRPVIQGGKRVTLRVPDSAIVSSVDPEDIPRTQTSKASTIRKDGAEMLALYEDGKLDKTSLQYKVIEHAIATGEVVETTPAPKATKGATTP